MYTVFHPLVVDVACVLFWTQSVYMVQQEDNGPIDSRAKLIDSDCKFYFIFEINNLRYPNIYEHVASNSHSDGP